MYKNQVYVYPDRSFSLKPDTNPYIQDLVTALKAEGTEVVRSRTAWLGSIDIFFYIRSIDAVVFNWIEEVANRKMGYIQAMALLLLIPTLRALGVKIIWTVHNKTSHNPRNRHISNYFREILSRKADIIIAHSKESNEALGVSHVTYYPHPFKVDRHEKPVCAEYEYDILFWGTILPYKGIKEFLDHIKTNGELNLRICIQGKCPDTDYLKSIKSFESHFITINNVFTSDEDLKYLFQKSRVVVFTYKSESVLSSGALIESLVNYKTVIGPNFGNFKDCEREGLAYTYSDFSDLVEKVIAIRDNSLSLISEQTIENYINNYSWSSYANYLKKQIVQREECELVCQD